MTAPEPVPVLPTERLVLRPLRAAHATEMAEVLSDPELYSFIGGAPPSVRTLRSRYERWEAGSPDPAELWCNWVLEARDDSRLTGTVQATVTRHDDGTRTAEIAWVVGTPWQGWGIATEAARALVAWLRGQRVTRIVAHVHPRHPASEAVAAAAGLSPTDDRQDGEVRWETRVLTADLDGLRDAVRRDAGADQETGGEDGP
ncbi:acetyltransferase [Streptomyces daqingensis]|uniref:Acetyltransferase n=1 Tax=Streptomyces daqingensis TaxID=1472640 RepID=A0ABQ2MF15_9ACTN|nr:GNAT family N-acetyltransferase [Streptomyces daqingensis]GGO50593.1 acetyltransferase [Streptomyces daqingensis]